MAALKGYQGFGSFHTDNVEALVALPDDAYVPPRRLPAEAALFDAAAPPPEFGAPMRAHFLLDPEWTFINHGAFGAASRVAVAASRAWADHAEAQPLRFIDRELLPLQVAAIRAAAAVVRCPPRCLAVIQNATYGLNVAIAAAAGALRPGDVIFTLDVAYGSVKKMLAAAAARAGATLVVAPLRFPVTGADDITAQVEAALPPRVALALFDHVASNTGLVLPVERLVAAAQARGARVIVDGAHGLQSLSLDLPALGAHWYTTNCHKWLAATKGVALLYAAPDVVPLTRAVVISHGYGDGFTSEFVWDGTRDYTGAVALPAVLAWWEWVGHERARAYCRALLRDAVALLTAAWGTGTHAPLECYSHMACVALPVGRLPPGVVTTPDPSSGGDGPDVPSATPAHGKAVQDALHYAHAIEVPAKTLDRRLYVRISAAVYNTLDDYRALADAVASFTWAPDGSYTGPAPAAARGGGGGL
jgi:isopenicillin-N epimerase